MKNIKTDHKSLEHEHPDVKKKLTSLEVKLDEIGEIFLLSSMRLLKTIPCISNNYIFWSIDLLAISTLIHWNLKKKIKIGIITKTKDYILLKLNTIYF